MTTTGEEIILLPYDNDLDGNGGDNKTTKTVTENLSDNECNEAPKAEQDAMNKDGEGENLLLADENQEDDNFVLTGTSPSDEGKLEPKKHNLPPQPNQKSQLEAMKLVGLPRPEIPQIQPVFPEPDVYPSATPNTKPPQLEPEDSALVQPHHPQTPLEPTHSYQPQSVPVYEEESGMRRIIATGMSSEMQQRALLLADQALMQFPNNMMAVAQHIMKNFENQHGPSWHCIVSDGELGFYMRYDPQNYIYFVISKHTIFLYKNFTS